MPFFMAFVFFGLTMAFCYFWLYFWLFKIVAANSQHRGGNSQLLWEIFKK
jgi:hypothetical protein